VTPRRDRAAAAARVRRGPRLAAVVSLAAVAAVVGGVQPAAGQLVCLPLPRLLSVVPPGGRAGTEVEVVVGGERIEPAETLLFSHPALVARPKRGDDGKAVANTFIVTIAANAAVGVHDATLVTALGISSARAFSVGVLPETSRAAANTTVATATPLAVNTLVNAATTPQAVDHYRLELHRGQRIRVECAAVGIDSRLQPVVAVADAAGNDLAVERRDRPLDFTAEADGVCIVKVHDLSFQGGEKFFYRLVVREPAADTPRLPATSRVNSFSWPPHGLPERAAATEAEPNDRPADAGKIALPCDIAGVFGAAGDVDTFEFEAGKGDVWWVEVASDRLGAATDPAAVVQRVVQPVGADGAAERLEDVAEFDDIASPLKPSSQFYSYDGPPYVTGSADILGRLEIRESGRHRLLLRDLFGGTRVGPPGEYRLVIRRATPDFALVAWPLHMELRNGDRADLSKPFALRAGGTIAVEVVALRRDGFDGPIDLAVEGLPQGVTAAGLRIPKGAARGIVAITAADAATAAPVPLEIVGRAAVADGEIVRPCRIASVAWPIRDHSAELPQPRLVSGPMLTASAAEPFPLALRGPAGGPIEAVAGSTVRIPLSLVRRGKLTGSVTQLRAFGQGFDKAAAVDVPLSADAHEVPIDLGKLAIEPGRHTIVLYGAATVAYQPPPDGEKAAAAVDIAEIIVSEPIHLEVKPAAVAAPEGEKKS
jgi:hypothetical protein